MRGRGTVRRKQLDEPAHEPHELAADESDRLLNPLRQLLAEGGADRNLELLDISARPRTEGSLLPSQRLQESAVRRLRRSLGPERLDQRPQARAVGLAAGNRAEDPPVRCQLLRSRPDGGGLQRGGGPGGAGGVAVREQQVDLREARAILVEIERSGQEQQGEDHAVALSPLLRARTRSTCAVSAASQTGSRSRSAPVQSSTA